MRTIRFMAMAIALASSACASLPPIPVTTRGGSAPSQMEIITVAPAEQKSFCLRFEYSNASIGVYSRNTAQAYVQDGTCDSTGPRRVVQRIVVGWRYKGGALDRMSCDGADTCTFGDKSYGVAAEIICVSGSVMDGPWRAGGTTDYLNCAP